MKGDGPTRRDTARTPRRLGFFERLAFWELALVLAFFLVLAISAAVRAVIDWVR